MAPRDNNEVSVFTLATALLRQRGILVVGALIGFVLGAGAGLLFREYRAESRFRPEFSNSAMSRFAGLATQFGIALPNIDNDESLEFYEELAHSREILGQVAKDTFSFRVDPEREDSLSGDLLTLYSVEGDTPAQRLAKLLEKLGADVFVATHTQAGLVELHTRAPWPELAESINRHLLLAINEFNLQKRQSRARAEREFVEARLTESKNSLESAEGSLGNFLERNRRYTDSPQLTFEAARLQRRVDLAQQVFLSLSQAYEQARIEEVRNTPVLTVVDRPEGSARGSRGPVGGAILGTFIGLLLGLTLGLIREYLAAAKAEQSPEYVRFMELWHRGVGRWLPRWTGSLRGVSAEQ